MSGPGQFSKGDVVYVSVPFSDRPGQKHRPALIAGDPLANNHGDYTLVPITSTLWHGATDFILRDSDPEFAASGLSQSSCIRCHKLFVLPYSAVRRKIGAIGPATRAEVERLIKKSLGI